jgi:PEP-CTERM motif
MNKKYLGVSVAVVLCTAMATYAGTLVDFVPQPASPVTADLVWTGTSLIAGPGAIGNGDGALPLSSQTPGGLQLVAPFIVPGVPGSVIDAGAITTTFYDTTMVLSGLTPLGPAVVTPIIPGLSLVTQPLNTGSFQLWDTTNTVLLLSGNISSAAISGPLNNSTGAVATLDLAVLYTGGVILPPVQGPGAYVGQFSWSLLDIAPPLSVNLQTGLLNTFTANSAGQFSGTFDSHVPEPATLALVGLGGTLILGRRRRAA